MKKNILIGLKQMDHGALLSIIMVIGMLVIALLIGKNDAYENRNISGDVVYLRQWTVEKNGETSKLSLPASFRPEKTGIPYRISCVLKEDHDFRNTPYLMMSVNHCDIKVYADDQLIFTQEAQKHGYSRTDGTQYLLVPMPADYAGKRLTIELTPLLNAKVQYKIRTPMLGTQADIIYEEFSHELLSIVLEFALLIVGIELLIIGAIIRGRSDFGKHMARLGMAAFCCALYLCCQG
jgi:hypothetical protein